MGNNLLAERYEIEAEIGHGASSTVFRARDTVLERTVALKVLSGVLATDPSFTQRFQQEARLAARLDHAHIVTIYDVGVLDDGRAYISMRLLDGSNLADLIDERAPLPAAEAIHLIRQLADALDYMHKAGLVHRDIKPSNVIVGPGNWLTLTDFGIARALEATRLTLPGMALGTPRYMAPEQVRGEDVGSATDIYALGVIAFELLVGHPPFESEGTALMYQIVHDEPPALSGTTGQLSPEIAAVLRRALAKNPSGRWESATAFAQALAGSGPDQTSSTMTAMTPAMQTETMTQVSPSFADNTAVSPIPQIDQTMLSPTPGNPTNYTQAPNPPTGGYGQPPNPPTGGYTQAQNPPTGGYTQASNPPTGVNPTNYTQAPNPPTGGYGQPPNPPTGSNPAYFAGQTAMPGTPPGGQPPYQNPPSDNGYGAPMPAPQPAIQQQQAKKKGFPWLIVVGGIAGVAVLAAIALFLSRGGEGGGIVSNLPGIPGTQDGQANSGAPLRMLSPSDGSGVVSPVTVSVAVSPSFPIKPATLGDPGAFHLHYFVDIDPSSLPSGIPIPTGQSGIIHSAETTLTIDQPLAVGEHTIYAVLTKNDHIPLTPPIVAKATFRVLKDIGDAPGVNEAPIVFYSNVGTPGRWHVFVVDKPGSAPRQLTSGNSDNVRSSFSPDGSQIVFRTNREGGRWFLYIMNSNGTSQRALTRPDGSQIEGDSPSWSPDGSKIAFHSFKDGGEQIQVFNIANGEVQQLTRLPNNNVSPTWSPDGTKIAFQSDRAGNQQIFIMDADGRNQTQLTTGARNHHFPAWSPDGRLIAFSMFEDNTYKIYTITTAGQDLKKVTDGGGDSGDQSPSWTPNAKYLTFESTRASSEHRVFVVEVANGNVQQITSGRAQDQAPKYPAR